MQTSAEWTVELQRAWFNPAMASTDEDAALADWLAHSSRFGRLTHVECCESTQSLARAQLPGSALFWADHQSAGRGRQGRTWDDESGSDLALTYRVEGLMLKNPTHLAAATPVAIARALAPLLSQPIRIKWPNDVHVEGRKLAGVLIDATSDPTTTHLIGIGVNVNRSGFPAPLEAAATSLRLLAGHPFDRHELVRQITASLDSALTDLECNRHAALAELFRSGLTATSGSFVDLTIGDRRIRGDLLDLTLDEIVVGTPTGSQKIALAHVQQLRVS